MGRGADNELSYGRADGNCFSTVARSQVAHVGHNRSHHHGHNRHNHHDHRMWQKIFSAEKEFTKFTLPKR